MAKKQNKVYLASGVAWHFDKNGNRVAVDSLDEANQIQSECCGLNCCENIFRLPVNDASSTDTYPASFQFVNVGGTIKLRVTVDLGAGNVVKEVTLT